MRLTLPRSLHYPITVTELLKQPADHVERFAPLFAYTFKTTVTEGNREGDEFQVEKTYPSRFESSVEGTLKTWNIGVGDVIKNASFEIGEVEEPCDHSVQFGGMCGICGKDMTERSYVTTQSDVNRANINMIHDNTSLTVSQDEALRVEGEAKRRLLAARKLSLVVDLDQTIIHATVDPTVGEWQKDPNNPNYPAIKDVRKFQLTDEGPGGKGTWYYIKLRPGLEAFLENISKIYELHIYTMGTRAYAQNIAKLVDPDRKIFGDRILSRDESGSMVAKNLQRLFPVDTKMVVIIDDRGDVWHWNPNLVKVTPFSFFVGIGDINSSFLPKRSKTRAPPPQPKSIEPKPESNGISGDAKDADGKPLVNGNSAATNTTLAEPQVSALEQLVSMGGGDNPEILKEQNESQDKLLAAQLEERPLLQKQKQLEEEDTDEDSDHPKHHLLNDNDNELYYLENSLRSVHTEFFKSYDQQLANNAGGRLAELRGSQTSSSNKRKPTANSDLDLIPDVKVVMPQVKSRVLNGVNIVFSGVIPLDADPQSAEIVIWAKSFGARVQSRVRGKSTTHVVAARNRTAKVRQAVARGKGRIKIVNLNWLLACIVQWARVDETPYLLKTGDADIGKPLPNEEEDGDLSGSASLSSSNQSTDAGGTESEADLRIPPRPKHLRVLTPRKRDDGTTTDEEDLADFAPPPDMDSPDSPVGGFKEDWEDMHAELLEFMDSDADDSDGDSLSSRSLDTNSRLKPPPKRTHDDMTGSDVSTGSASGGGKGRKKLAMGRGSGLRKNEISENGLPTPVTGFADEGKGADGDGDGWDDFDPEDADFLLGDEDLEPDDDK